MMTNEEIIDAAILGLQARIAELRARRSTMADQAGPKAVPPTASVVNVSNISPAIKRPRRKMSPEGRAKIAAATKARWAAFRASKEQAAKTTRKRNAA